MFQNEKTLGKRVVLFVLSLTFYACSPAADEILRITTDRIYFLNGDTSIELGARDTFHVFSGQNLLVYVEDRLVENTMKMHFFNFTGQEIAATITVHGSFSFIFAEAAERVLAGSLWTWHNRSYLFDLSGNLLSTLVHNPESKEIGITSDEKYLWFVTNRMRPLYPGETPFRPDLFPGFMYTPYNHIMLFDARTGEFLDSFSTRETTFTFTIDGMEYSINMTPPDIPG